MNSKVNAICFFSIALLGVYITVYQSIINTFIRSYTIDGTVMGTIISLHFAGSFLAPAVFGEISNRIGRKIVIYISYIIFIIGLLAIYISNNLTIIALSIFFIGCGFGIIESTLSAVLVDTNIEKANRVISISQMFFCIGAVSGPVFALWIKELSGNWKTMFLVSMALFVFLLIYIILSKPKLDNKKDNCNNFISDSNLISFKLLKDRPYIILCISIFIYVGMEEAIAFWTTTYFHDVFRAESLGIYALSGYWGGMILGRYIGSRFEVKYREFIIAGLLVSLISLSAALIIKNGTFNLICFFILGIGFSVIWPMLMAFTARLYPEYTGPAFGIMMTFSAAGGIVLPFFTGMLMRVSGINIAFCLILAMVLLLILLQQSKELKTKRCSF